MLTTAPYPLPPGLLEGRSHRAASVVCTEDVEVMVMDREVFNRVVMDDDKGGGKNKCANERHLERDRGRVIRSTTAATARLAVSVTSRTTAATRCRNANL